jgi:hypothetical protein
MMIFLIVETQIPAIMSGSHKKEPMTENPYSPHVEAFKQKIAIERETEVSVKLKGKHISMLRDILREAELDMFKDQDLIKEIEKILYDAHQKI